MVVSLGDTIFVPASTFEDENETNIINVKWQQNSKARQAEFYAGTYTIRNKSEAFISKMISKVDTYADRGRENS